MPPPLIHPPRHRFQAGPAHHFSELDPSLRLYRQTLRGFPCLDPQRQCQPLHRRGRILNFHSKIRNRDGSHRNSYPEPTQGSPPHRGTRARLGPAERPLRLLSPRVRIVIRLRRRLRPRRCLYQLRREGCEWQFRRDWRSAFSSQSWERFSLGFH